MVTHTVFVYPTVGVGAIPLSIEYGTYQTVTTLAVLGTTLAVLGGQGQILALAFRSKSSNPFKFPPLLSAAVGQDTCFTVKRNQSVIYQKVIGHFLPPIKVLRCPSVSI